MDGILGGLDIWKFLGGLAFFQLGMHALEQAIAQLLGRPVKLLLRRFTHNPLQGIVTGAVTTALLQSSSLVSLLTLAFVGAGILSLRDALGVIFGANIGTTFTGWIVATLGFRLDVEAAALPLIAVGGLGSVFFHGRRPLEEPSRLVLGLGFLLLGLAFMKASVESLAGMLDLSVFAAYGMWLFVLVGFAFTAIVQASAATMMVNLSALAAGLVTLQDAAAVAVGADVGTTITVVLGALRGAAVKKRVALSHILYNVVSGAVALLLLPWLLAALRRWLGMSDPLYLLVAFHTTFNVLGIALFLPILGPFARFLERRFRDSDGRQAIHVHMVSPKVPEAALEALEKEAVHILRRVLVLNADMAELSGIWTVPSTLVLPHAYGRRGIAARYASIKQLEGEILDYTMLLQEQALSAAESARLSQILLSVRNAVQAAKAFKDIQHNLVEFRESIKDVLHERYRHWQKTLADFYACVGALWQLDRPAARFAELASLADRARSVQHEEMRSIYAEARADRLDDIEISTLLNVNREMYVSNRALVRSLGDLLLPAEETSRLTELT